MTHFSSELTTGLIVKSTKIWRWQLNLIRSLLDAELLNVTEIFLLGTEDPVLPANVARLHKLDSIIFRSPMNAFELVDVDVLGISPSAIDKVDFAVFSEIDLLVNFSENTVSAEVKAMVNVGLLETWFSPQDSSESLRSVNFGFAEFDQSHKQCYFSVTGTAPDLTTYRLSESRPSLDSGSLSRNMNQYWKLIEATWIRICKRLQTETLAQIQQVNITQDQSRVQTDAGQGGQAYKNFAAIFVDKFSQKFLRKEQWVLLLQFQSEVGISTQLPLSFAEYSEISPPDDCFWADPFVISDNGKHYVFFEELPFATELGHLSCMEVFSDGSHTEPKIILKKPYHLSYPNVFKHNSEFYMIPESGDTGCISLYHGTDFPYQWEYQHNLMEGLHAYDSTLLEHEGLWWLFACVAAEKGMSGCEELHIFFADSPLSQSWKPHQLNPIMSDASRARPAGKFFESGGELYRPSQDCAGSYGAGLNINKIKTLTKENYLEELVHCSRPTWDSKLTALHTLNFNQHVSVADAMRIDNRYF